MRKTVLLCLLVTMCIASVSAQRQCGSMDHLHSEMQQDPKRAHKLQLIEQHTNEYLKNHKHQGSRDVITIPVVFHVVWRTSSENISTAQIQTQLDVLNEDFRRLNADADNVWPQGADTEIEFCLASIDPSGNTTSGITRTQTSVNGFGTNNAVKFNSSGGKDAWPSGDYLNFWICNIGGGILGYAQFPGGNPATDGVVNDYRYTGTIGTATAPFDLGRTATHEVGHWLNLRHIWGDGNCNADDFVSDTPTSDAPNYGCAVGHVSCNSTDMVQNYMDYSDDGCMNLFTEGQKTRMNALFAAGGSRASLLVSNGCGNSNPPPPGCDDNVVNISITLDNYPEETSWTISDASGTTVASGGTYGSQADGSTINLEACVVDGCYDFTINDSYGDGICCSYGNGSYSVSAGGQTVASGGSFGSSESTNFCLGSGSSPTCSDGVQNGDEEGVDCGGSNCAPCPSCNDGVQNGNETGVDCGGDCSPCGGGSGSDQLLASYFETGLDGWIDGGSDCFRYSGGNSWEGSYSIRLRDNSGTASSMTSPALDLTGYSSVDVSFYFYPNSMENGEDFWLRYNDGSGWQTVATYASGSQFTNNSFYTATVTLSASQYNLVNGATFRFQCDASTNADRIYIDEVVITGNGAGVRTAEGGSSLSKLYSQQSTIGLDESGFAAYPNPASEILNIVAEEMIRKVEIRNITGQLVQRTAVQADNITLQISDLQPGLYLITVESEEEVMTKKFVKQ